SIDRGLRASQAGKKTPGLIEDAPRAARTKKKEVVIEESTIYLLPAPAADIPSELITALTERGVMGALLLLKALSSEQLERVSDVIEYWDEIKGEKGAGLLVNLVKSTDLLPPYFESSRQRRAREEAARHKRTIETAKDF